MRFSLIVATLGRTAELVALLESLCRQTFQDFDVVVVDQNDDARLQPIIQAFSDRLRLKHATCSKRNSSVARNQGVALSTGDIVAFPDDDCEYPPDVLTRVAATFDADPSLALLSGPAQAPNGRLGSGRWRAAGGAITLTNVWISVIEFNLFVTRPWIQHAGGFDERIGVGARFGSGEGTDLVATILGLGGRALYDPSLRVTHPDKTSTDVAVARAFVYGVGMGFVLRKHPFGFSTRLTFLARPLLGGLLNLVSGRLSRWRYYLNTFRGRLAGMQAEQKQ
jgi:glycosyltransferase involved in cell wall biosynthesis